MSWRNHIARCMVKTTRRFAVWSWSFMVSCLRRLIYRLPRWLGMVGLVETSIMLCYCGWILVSKLRLVCLMQMQPLTILGIMVKVEVRVRMELRLFSIHYSDLGNFSRKNFNIRKVLSNKPMLLVLTCGLWGESCNKTSCHLTVTIFFEFQIRSWN